MIPKIKLMADYGCYPLWWVDGKKGADINPSTLPLSQETIDRLEKWQAIYDNILNWEDPATTDFSSPEAEEAFDQEGISLWLQLREELSEIYEVVYFQESVGKVLKNPEDLEEIYHNLVVKQREKAIA